MQTNTSEPVGSAEQRYLWSDYGEKSEYLVVIVTHNSILAEAADKVIKIKNNQLKELLLMRFQKGLLI